MITQAPIGSIIMFADGAGTLTPQYGGSVDLFPKSFTNGVIIQASSSLQVNGYLKDKVVQHQYTRITGSATHTATYMQTERQWDVTGSYICYAGSAGHTINLAAPNPSTNDGLLFHIYRTSDNLGTSLLINAPAGIFGNVFDESGVPLQINSTAVQAYRASGTVYSYPSIELIWNSSISKWFIKSVTGIWT